MHRCVALLVVPRHHALVPRVWFLRFLEPYPSSESCVGTVYISTLILGARDPRLISAANTRHQIRRT